MLGDGPVQGEVEEHLLTRRRRNKEIGIQSVSHEFFRRFAPSTCVLLSAYSSVCRYELWGAVTTRYEDFRIVVGGLSWINNDTGLEDAFSTNSNTEQLYWTSRRRQSR